MFLWICFVLQLASLGLDLVMVGFQVNSSAQLPDVVMTGCLIVFPLFYFFNYFESFFQVKGFIPSTPSTIRWTLRCT